MTGAAQWILTEFLRGLGALLILAGLCGLWESMRWATVESDRVVNFSLGAFLFLLGVVALRVA